MNPSASLINFLKTGIKPTSDRERSALLDECRSAIHEVASQVRNWTPPTDPAGLDRLERASKAAKAERDRQFEATKKAHAEQTAKRLEIEKRTAAKAKPAVVKFQNPTAERNAIRAQYAAIKDPAAKRAFRLQNWSKLNPKI